MKAQTPSFGLQLPTVDGFHRGYSDIRPTVRAAEAVGFDSVWVGDHLVANAPIVESVVAATTAAAVSDRLRIGFGVMVAALRHPAWIGKQVSSLQAVSGGRVELGIGVGGEVAVEWVVAGVPAAERGRRTDTLLRALPDLLTGREAKLESPWDVTVPPLKPHGEMPAIWIGGRSDVALRRAVAHRAGWMGLWADDERVRRAKQRLSELSDEMAKPMPPIGVQVLVHPSDDPARGVSELGSFMEEIYRIPFARLRRYALSGGHEAIVDRLSGLVEAGAQSVVLIPALHDYAPCMRDMGAIIDAVRARVTSGTSAAVRALDGADARADAVTLSPTTSKV